jgi:glycerate-2-kinase
MGENLIKNFDELATTPNRKIALEIMEVGLNAINTSEVIKNKIKLDNNILIVDSQLFDLNEFKNIKVVGFGKSSGVAAIALEGILGDKITTGAVISLEKIDCKHIETFAGTHPRPSEANIEAGKKIYEIIKDSTSDDLIIVLVSGGGSALFCYPEDEYIQGAKLYDAFLRSGKTISEINTVRKHLSMLKGGGLAKLAYPANVVGLIFSDVPGDVFENVASGATYKDETTIADAQKIITENNLGEFNLIETPKEDKYFEKVHNFILVSNKTAVEAMEKKGEELGLQTKIISTDLYSEVDEALKKIFSSEKENTVVLAAGEPSVVVPKNAGKGGRNLHMGLEAIKNKMITKENYSDSVFISFASDGMDNSDVAGAIVDKTTIEKAEKLGLNAEDYSNNFNSYDFFQKTKDQIITGPTGANVSDLMILLTKK